MNLQKHPIFWGIISTLILFGLPVILFPEIEGGAYYLCVLAEIFLLIGIIFIVARFNSPDKSTLILQQEKYESLLKEYNVPEIYYKGVIHDSLKYNLFYTPVVMWRENNIINVLTINEKPHVIKTPVAHFKTVSRTILNKHSQYEHREQMWHKLPLFIKSEFSHYMNYYNIYDAKNRDITYGTYFCGGFNFCTNSLNSLFKTINEPLEFYQLDTIIKNFLTQKITQET